MWCNCRSWYIRYTHSPTMTSRLVILISGNGSNLQAVIDAIASSAIAKATVSLVVSNRKDAYGLQRYVICSFSNEIFQPLGKMIGVASSTSHALRCFNLNARLTILYPFYQRPSLSKDITWGYIYIYLIPFNR